jgi:8-oxo-dGTP diphosphatase
MNLGGKWHVIGGKVEENETEEEAIKREIKEETNLDIKILKKIGERIVKSSEGELAKVVTFICEAKDENPIPQSDLVDVKWVEIDKFFINICEESKMMLPENIISVLKYYQQTL